MAVVFAKSLCRMRDGQSGATLMSYRNAPVPNGDSATRSDKIGNAKYDAIAHYAGIFDAQKMNIDSSGAESLKSLYTLGIGLGMRESSGEHCTGYDTSAGPETAEEAEAGLFQTSYNAIGTSTELRKIYADYNAGNSNCRLDIFSKNVSCANQPIIGTGAGADFQRKLKSCPALAAEFAMITLRVVRTHYGPINRQEAEVRPECHDMLDDVQSYVEHDPINVCQQL